jgi:hypothetical protein
VVHHGEQKRHWAHLDTVDVVLMIVEGLGLVISIVMLACAREDHTTVALGTTRVQAGATVVEEARR